GRRGRDGPPRAARRSGGDGRRRRPPAGGAATGPAHGPARPGGDAGLCLDQGARGVGGRVRRGIVMRLQRLLSLGMVGLADRGLQESRKWLERRGLARSDLRKIRAEEDRLGRFRRVSAGRFFAGAMTRATPFTLAARMPEARTRTLQAADDLWKGRFDLLGYRALSF